ncbi:hypothetical protein AB6A23_12380 [Paenibacillus tarimensis]
MEKKRCFFCNETVEVDVRSDCEWYIGCNCSPDGEYGLRSESIDQFHSLAYAVKREMFPIISAYIREKTDCGEEVRLTIEDVNSIKHSADRPATVKEKGARLLQYLHRHSSGPNEPVVIHPFSRSFNLTYSLTLQEFVYIITNLLDEQVIEREGNTLRLTEKGWREAVAGLQGRTYKPCVVLLSDVHKQHPEWSNNILPTIERCGYIPQVAEKPEEDLPGCQTDRLLSKCKLVIADLSGHLPDVYFAAGLALGMNKTVIWTVPRSDAGRLPVRSELIRPMVWGTTDELAAMLHERLTLFCKDK